MYSMSVWLDRFDIDVVVKVEQWRKGGWRRSKDVGSKRAWSRYKPNLEHASCSVIHNFERTTRYHLLTV